MNEIKLSDLRNTLESAYTKEEARQLCFILLESLGFERTKLLAETSVGLNKNQKGFVEESMQKLLKQMPIQQLLGEAHFYGFKLKVNEHTLIPRPETEELVDWIVKENQKIQPSVLDIGTGSGAIALALASILQAKTFAIDSSAEALKVARENAKRYNLQIDWIEQDILKQEEQDLKNLEDLKNLKNLDIVVSNPPYIPEQDIGNVEERVKKYEPYTALFVPQNTPIVFYECIAKLSLNYLSSSSLLYFEIYDKYASEVKVMLENLGYFEVEIRKDMQGKDRMIRATKA